MTSHYFQQWLTALLLTQLIEAPLYRYGFGVRWPVALMASFITHPVVWFVIPYIISVKQYLAYFLLAESFAVVAEALWLKSRGVSKPWLASLCTNGVSASLGLLLQDRLSKIGL